MSIRIPDPAFTHAQWVVQYHDGKYVSDHERTWNEISVPYGPDKLMVLTNPAASLTAIVKGRAYTLRAPDQDTYFFRYFRARTSLSSPTQSEILYHAIGYLTAEGKVWCEIDSSGNCQFRTDTFKNG